MPTQPKVKIEDVIEFLETSIRLSEYNKEHPDEMDWENNIGILLTTNQAKAIVEWVKEKQKEK